MTDTFYVFLFGFAAIVAVAYTMRRKPKSWAEWKRQKGQARNHAPGYADTLDQSSLEWWQRGEDPPEWKAE